MAHEIEASDKLVLVGREAWHGLGDVLPAGTVLTPGEAVKQALPWEPQTVELCREDNYATLKTHKAVVRSDTKDLLGIVSDRYTVFPNSLLGELADHIGGDRVSVETAGSFRGGKRAWILCRDEGADWEAVSGDLNKGYALLTVGHDGTQALTVKPTSVRVVCANTHNIALSRTADRTYRWHHADDLNKDTLFREARDSILGLRAAAMEQEYIAKQLVSKQMNTAQMEQFFCEVYARLYAPIPTNPTTEAEDEARTDALERIANWTGLLQSKTNTLPGMRGTKWAAVNAVTEWINHHRRTRGDRTVQNLMGAGADMTRKVFEVATAS